MQDAMTKHDYGYVLRNFDCEITHLAQGLTDPVGMSHAELAAFYQSIRERNDYGRRFYLTMAMRPPYTPFSHKVEDFLPVDGNLNDAQYFALIHPDYLEDYLNWSSAIYRFVYQYKDALAPFRHNYVTTSRWEV